LNKYFAEIDTEHGSMIMVVKANNEEEAKNKLHENYNFNKIIQLSNKSPGIKEGKREISSLYAYAKYTYSSNNRKNQKRFIT